MVTRSTVEETLLVYPKINWIRQSRSVTRDTNKDFNSPHKMAFATRGLVALQRGSTARQYMLLRCMCTKLFDEAMQAGVYAATSSTAASSFEPPFNSAAVRGPHKPMTCSSHPHTSPTLSADKQDVSSRHTQVSRDRCSMRRSAQQGRV